MIIDFKKLQKVCDLLNDLYEEYVSKIEYNKIKEFNYAKLDFSIYFTKEEQFYDFIYKSFNFTETDIIITYEEDFCEPKNYHIPIKLLDMTEEEIKKWYNSEFIKLKEEIQRKRLYQIEKLEEEIKAKKEQLSKLKNNH